MKLDELIGFEWDEGNSDKNFLKHGISDSECEEVFYNIPLLLADDRKHSKSEQRFYVLGKTNRQRLIFLAFTVRNQKIRIISSRDMTESERVKYAQKSTGFQKRG